MDLFCYLCLSLPYCVVWFLLVCKKADLLVFLYVIISCVFVTFPFGVLGQLW